MRIEYGELIVHFYADETVINGKEELKLSDKMYKIQERLEDFMEAEVRGHEFTFRIVSC